jgi:hypothetical protein
MPAHQVIGTWADIFAPHSAEVQQIGLTLRALILRLHPQAVQVARPGDNGVTFGLGPRKMLDGYLYLAPHRGRVNLGFYQGAALVDNSRVLEGTGKALRHVKVCDLATASQPALAELIGQAIARQQEIGNRQ